MAKVKPIPEGRHTVTPHLTVKGCAQAIEFYKKAFGAREISRHAGPDGGIMHAEIKIGDSGIFLNDEFPQMRCLGPLALNGTPVVIHLQVEDVDKLFSQAVQAGATALMPVADMFWGDRYGVLEDPFGHRWSVATHQRDLTPAEIKKAMQGMGGAG